MTISQRTMTSCLPGADSGGSQGSAGLASLNESVASVNASPVLSPNETGSNVPHSISNLNFSASSLCNSAAGSTTASMAASTAAGNELSAAAAAAAQLNLSDCDPARLAAAGLPYPRLSSGLGSMYSAAAAAATYPSNDQNPYPSIAMADNFYGSLGNPTATPGAADMTAWPSATALQPTGYYAGYDHPSLAAYGYGAGYDLASRRKNATRESTATLKAWLNEHKKNPYPTKGEKIMLAIITKMTLTQVSTWFANARRRLKKENKMTWEPKNKLDDEDVDVSDDDDVKDRDDEKHDETDHRHMMGLHHGSSDNGDSKSSAGIPIPPSKPKIWSLADTAVCKTPPPPNHSAQPGHGQPPGMGNPGQHYGQSGQQPGAQPSQYLPTSAWGPNFSQFVTDPNLMRLRHPGLGMGYMGLPPPPVSQPSFSSGPLGHPTASPGLNSDGVQSNNDTPPHTPPNGPKPSQFGPPGSGGNSSYNSLHNGYSQMSPSLQGEAGGVASAASKMLMFNNMNNTASSFKMM